MERMVPQDVPVQIVAPHYPKLKTGRPPFGIETMLRIHYLQQCSSGSARRTRRWKRRCTTCRRTASSAKLEGVMARRDDPPEIRHLLERYDVAVNMLRFVNDILQAKGLMMSTGTAVDATLMSSPSSTENAGGERDREMKPTRKGNNSA